MTHPTTQTMSAALLLALLALSACRDHAPPPAQKAAIEQGKAAMAYWEDKCKTVAGEKIYRKVEGVEGILLLKVRPKAWDNEWHDRNFPGAAFAREAQADEYITSFLGYEYGTGGDGGPTPITPTSRGYIATDKRDNVPSKPGYRYIDVIDEKDGKRYRYSGRWEEPWLQDKSWRKGYIKFDLDRVPAPDPAPRYAVTYEDHVIPEERALGVASSTLKVIDTQTNEVLGESTRYAVTGGFDTKSSTSPWLVSRVCPTTSGLVGTWTRQFADQILIPEKHNDR